jgi:hypothetical protein
VKITFVNLILTIEGAFKKKLRQNTLPGYAKPVRGKMNNILHNSVNGVFQCFTFHLAQYFQFCTIFSCATLIHGRLRIVTINSREI